jgi:arylsulfatase A-like enzyme
MRSAEIYDDSAVFLFSDHGDFTGDYGLVEKTQNTFEDVLSRVPFIVKPPKVSGVKPRVSDAIVELVDFSATVFELTGIEPGYTHFGKSLLPLLRGDTQEHRDAAFCEGGRLTGESQAMELPSLQKAGGLSMYMPRIALQTSDEHPWHTKAVMCRTKEYKYTRRHYESDELYDLGKDPKEMNNLIEDPAYADVLIALKERMLQWYMETCDVVPMQGDERNF